MSTLLDTFRALSSFSPSRQELRSAPWEEFVDWALAQGLAPLAAYNLEYRLAGAGAPEWARDRLLSVYQGSLNDNVMKLVNFKRAVDELEGMRVVLLGAASLAEAVYPHVAFRPVLDLRLWLAAQDLDACTAFLAQHHFRPTTVEDPEGATRVLSDGRTQVLMYTQLFGPGRAAQESQVLSRALPMKVYGPSLFRPDLEDAILLTCLEQARAGYEIPMISFIDLRELLLGAPAMGGPYSRPVEVGALKERARELRLERACYASFSIVERLFPESSKVVAEATPVLRAPTRALLDRLLVEPVSTLGRVSTVRGAGRLRQLLSGG